MSKAAQLVGDRYILSFAPTPIEPIPSWAKREVKVDKTSPISGAYDVTNSPYAEEWFAAWQDPAVRMQTTIGPNQGGRTKAMEVASLWSITNNPGPLQWNGKDNEKAKRQARQRWWPMARACKPVAAKCPTDTRIKAPVSFELSDEMPVTFQGANEGNLQEVSILTQFNDECFQWPAGMLPTAWKRCDVSYAWSHKIWNGSIASDEGHDLESAFNKGDKREWCFTCVNPKCKHPQEYKWGKRHEKGGVKWENSERTRPGGTWDMEAVRRTVYYECEKCQFKHADNLRIRELMNNSGFYRPENWENLTPIKRNGKPFYPFGEVVSFRYNILAVNWPGVTWANWVVEFLNAVEAARRYADYKGLEGFWVKRMGQFWNEAKYVNMGREMVVSDYRMYDDEDKPVYAKEKWPGEIERFMAVDKQELGYYFGIRAVTKDGESRLIDRGELDSYDEIEAKADEFGVSQSRVVIDCQHETRDVYAAAIKRGWVCLRGDDKESYLHILTNKATKQKFKVFRPYSERKMGDPGFRFQEKSKLASQYPGLIRAARQGPTYARLFFWSNLSIKNLLSSFKQGRATIYWGIPSDVGKDYLKQMGSEVRYRKQNAKGITTYFWSNCGIDGKAHKKPNHYWDVECMLLTCMVMAKLINLDKYQNADEVIQATASIAGNTNAEEEEPFEAAA